MQFALVEEIKELRNSSLVYSPVWLAKLALLGECDRYGPVTTYCLESAVQVSGRENDVLGARHQIGGASTRLIGSNDGCKRLPVRFPDFFHLKLGSPQLSGRWVAGKCGGDNSGKEHGAAASELFLNSSWTACACPRVGGENNKRK
jgi:hypothetical protein